MGVVPTLLGAAPAVSSGFKSIGTTQLAAAAAAVTFSGISSTYKEFIISACLLPVTDSVVLYLRLNNDSGANYDEQGFTVGSTTLSNGAATGLTAMRLNSNETQDNNYAALAVVTIFKEAAGLEAMMHVRAQIQQTTPAVALAQSASRWNNVAALINRFDVLTSSGNLNTGSLVRLEGLVP